MKRLLSIVLFCVLVPYAYGEIVNWTDDEGNTYVGEVKNGKFHGHGILTWAEDGRKYVGDFKNSEMHGQATLVFPNGDRLVGEWRNNEYWSAIAYDANGAILGTVTNGEWCEGCKPESTATASNSTASNSTALNSSYVWCATQTGKFQTTKDYCKSRGGKVFSTESQAKAEHKRLKGGSSSSSTTAAATAPSPSPRKVWCATKADYSVESSKSECENLGGKDFSHNSDGYRLAKAEHERLKVCSSRPPTRSSYEPWVWCATKVDYFVESSRSKCQQLGGIAFSHDKEGRRLADNESRRLRSAISGSGKSEGCGAVIGGCAGNPFMVGSTQSDGVLRWGTYPPCEHPYRGSFKSDGYHSHTSAFNRDERENLRKNPDLRNWWSSLLRADQTSRETRRLIKKGGGVLPILECHCPNSPVFTETE